MNYPKYLYNLLDIAVAKNASDLHISVGHPPILRITRTLQDIEGQKVLNAQDTKGLAFSLMSQPQTEELLKEKSIDLGFDFEGKARFRVNIFFQNGTVSAALRLIPTKIKTIDQLHLPVTMHDFIKSGQGFVLVTGATSQGKTTTLAALVDEINHSRREHIITIEHPIEYLFKDDKSLIEQREVYTDTKSFSQALKSALRQDPDVIMIGELRDLKTVSTAITAAETGHLVLGTLHTNSASQTIHRLIDVFPPHQQNQIRAQLASSLLGVASQRLLPAIKGGFLPACEIMINNPAISNLIRENKIHEIPTILETSFEQGMTTFNQSLADLIQKKLVAKEVAFKYSVSPDDLKSRL